MEAPGASMDAMESLLSPLSPTSPGVHSQTTQASASLPPAAPSAPPPLATEASTASFGSRLATGASATHSSMAEGVSAAVMMGAVDGVAAGVVSAQPPDSGRTHAPTMTAAPASLPTHGSRSGSSAHTTSAVVTGGAANSSVTAESVLQEAIALPAGERVLFFNDLRLHLHREGLLSVRNRASKRQRVSNGVDTMGGPPSTSIPEVHPIESDRIESDSIGSAPVGRGTLADSAPVRAGTLGQAQSHSGSMGTEPVGEVVSSMPSSSPAVGRPGPPPLTYSAAVTSTRPVTSPPAAGL